MRQWWKEYKSWPGNLIDCSDENLAVHGSLRRDLDLIAVPWVDVYSGKNVLAEAIQEVACGFTMSKYTWGKKPNGREATCFPICWPNHETMGSQPSLGHIDLSVIYTEAKDKE